MRKYKTFVPSPHNPGAFQFFHFFFFSPFLFLSFKADSGLFQEEMPNLVMERLVHTVTVVWRQISTLIHTSSTPASLVRWRESKPAFTFLPLRYFVILMVFISLARWFSSLRLLRPSPANTYAFFYAHAFSTCMGLCRIRAWICFCFWVPSWILMQQLFYILKYQVSAHTHNAWCITDLARQPLEKTA